MKKIILASGSPRRKQLLEMVGLEIQVIIPDVDEQQLDAEEPTAMVVRLAKLKANTIRTSFKMQENTLPIIAADTIVCLDEIVLGKPKDERDAIRILNLLSGKTHRVITGYIIQKATAEKVVEKTGFVSTLVTFRDLPEEQILTYIKTGEPLDKAGAYGIQGAGACLVDHINGSYTNVVGLPINEVLQAINNI